MSIMNKILRKLLPPFIAALVGLLIGYASFAGWHSYTKVTPQVDSSTLTPSASPDTSPTPSASASPITKSTDASHVLMYHYIQSGVNQKTDPVGYGLSVPPNELDAQIAAMKAAGYTSITMADYVAGKGDAKSVVMTFDDGYEDFKTTAYPILKKYNWTATIYIITGMIGGNYMTWDDLKEMKAAGIEIGAHTINHIDLSTASEATQRKEITQSKQDLESHLGGTVTSFCYPSGKYTTVTEALVKQAGFTSATTTHPGDVHHSDDMYALNRLRINPGFTATQLLKDL